MKKEKPNCKTCNDTGYFYSGNVNGGTHGGWCGCMTPEQHQEVVKKMMQELEGDVPEGFFGGTELPF